MSIASCSKSGEAARKDITPPEIVIITPTNNQIYNGGQTIQIIANASDNITVAQLHIHIKNKDSGAILRDIHAYPSSQQGTVQDSFQAVSGISYRIRVMAYDQRMNLAIAEVDVVVQ